MGWVGIRTVAVGVLGTLVACGPAAQPQWSIAVMRSVEGDYPLNTRVWLLDDDGRERAVPDVPNGEYRAPTQWIGWEPDGDALVLRQADVLWRWDGEELVDSTFVNPMFDTGTIEAAHVLDEGSVVARIRVSGAAIPGIGGFDRWSLARAADGTAEILASGSGVTYSVGKAVVLWTLTSAVLDPESETQDEYLISLWHFLLRDGRETELEGPPDAMPKLSPTADQIVWAGGEETIVTDLEAREVERFPAAADGVAWSLDGTRLAGWSDAGAWTYELGSGAVRHLEVGDTSHVAWSPDGETLAVEGPCASRPDHRVRVFDAAGESGSTECGLGYFAAWSPDGGRFALTRLNRAHGPTAAGPTRIVVVGDGPGAEIDGGFLGFRPR